MLSAPTATNRPSDFRSLKWWSMQINQHRYNLLVDRSNVHDHALILCLTNRHVNAGLQPCPTESLGLIPAEYTVLSKRHLCKTLFPADSEAGDWAVVLKSP